MSRFIPFPAYTEFAPLDISFLFESEKPAGKHGFLKVQGDRFVFEDGTPVRFWGTNLNGGACFPEKPYAEKLAKRLAAYGCNIVRLHQMDAEWACPNIYQLRRGKRLENTSTYDPDSLDRMDYLVHCMKQEGIYIYLDMMTYRKFKEADGVVNASQLKKKAGPYSLFDRRMIELQKEYMKMMWERVNPYTGLAYKDEPAIVMSEPINEITLFGDMKTQFGVEPYTSNFRKMLSDWCRENGKELDAETVDLNDKTNDILNEFKVKVTEDYYNEMFGYMRSLGVKIPFTGTNCSWQYVTCKSTQNIGDFNDSHLNLRFMKWKEDGRYSRDIALHELPEWGAMRNARMRKFGKPFFTSEWDLTFPNKYRAESTIMMAAVGMLQNWSGYTIHTYAYSSLLDHMDILGKESSSATLDSTGYREGIFSTWNDPAKFGLFYHGSIITRREDVKPANKQITIAIDNVNVDSKHAPGKLIKTDKKALLATTELSQIGVDYYGQCPDAVPDSEPLVNLKQGEVISDTGELYRNWDKKYGTVDTPKTKAVYGRLGQNDAVALNGMTVDCKNHYATIAVSSLNNDLDIEHTDSMLLTAVGVVENTDMKMSLAPEEVQKYNGYAPYMQMDDFGKAPIICEVIEADIAIKTDRTNLYVDAINAEGYSVGRVPVTFEDGCMHFTIGKTNPSVYYLIQAE